MENQLGNIIIYKTEEGKDKIEVKIYENTVWLSQKQPCELFNVSKSNISEHISNIYLEHELDENSTVRKFRTLATNENFIMLNIIILI